MIKETKRVHAIWRERQILLKKCPEFKTRNLVGKWQYIFSSKKGQISMVKFLNYFHDGDNFWEIYCLQGNFFDDVERFKTQKQARAHIKKLLEEENALSKR